MHTIATAVAMCGLAPFALAQHDAQNQRHTSAIYQVRSGVVTMNDGSFNYQGYLEVDGQPANGMYSFRFEAFEDATGSDIAHELYFASDLVPVVDGLFTVDVQMGGLAGEARRFWREIGDREMHLEIGVGMFEGGPYTTLGTRTRLSWSARAQYAGISEALRFPYADSFTDLNGDPVTMLSLSSTFGGTVLEAIVGRNEQEAIISVQSATPSGADFGAQTGGVHIDAPGRAVGLISISDQFGIAGLLREDSGSQIAAVLGQVNSGVPGAYAVQAINVDSGHTAHLAGPEYAGEFDGDVVVDGDIQRTYNGAEASAAPIAYGYVNASGGTESGTSNFSCMWNSTGNRYEITISNESYFFSRYTALITPGSSSTPRLASTSSLSGRLLVYILDPTAGFARVQSPFQFAVFKTDPNTTVINRNTTGMDDSEFYRLNGLTPEVIRTQSPAPRRRRSSGISGGR